MSRLSLQSWRRQLFGSVPDTVLSLGLGALMAWAAWGFLHWAFGQAQWLVVRANAATLAIGRYPEAQEWRLWLLLGMLVSLTGLSWGLLRGRG